jgi:hypothetical protein
MASPRRPLSSFFAIFPIKALTADLHPSPAAEGGSRQYRTPNIPTNPWAQMQPNVVRSLAATRAIDQQRRPKLSVQLNPTDAIVDGDPRAITGVYLASQWGDHDILLLLCILQILASGGHLF